MKYKPTGKRIIVRKIEAERVSNLILPNSNDPVIGQLVAVGSGCDTGISEGDVVMLTQGSRPFPLEDELFLYHESEVIVILEDYYKDKSMSNVFMSR